MATVPSPSSLNPGQGLFDTSTALVQGTAQINNQQTWDQQKLSSTFKDQTMPGLQGGIAGAGQWGSGASVLAQQNATQQFKNAGQDINMGTQNALNQLYTNGAYAATGTVMA